MPIDLARRGDRPRLDDRLEQVDLAGADGDGVAEVTRRRKRAAGRAGARAAAARQGVFGVGAAGGRRDAVAEVVSGSSHLGAR
jgi:hypothetical protein